MFGHQEAEKWQIKVVAANLLASSSLLSQPADMEQLAFEIVFVSTSWPLVHYSLYL